ncbi:TPA: hypothetical protein ACXIZC_002813 [Serratia marcescens]
MKNNLVNQDIKTDKPVPISYEALKADRDAQQKRADALAVENMALKKFGETLLEMRNDLNGTGTGIQGCHEAHIQQVGIEAAIDAFDEIETPATSAALAAIEARGVEKALAIVEACRGSICAGGLSENRQYEESIVQPHLDGIADELENLIIELREAK